MSSMWSNLVLQLGISGLIVFVIYKIAMKQLANARATEAERAKNQREADAERMRQQAATDAERNAIIAGGFRSITDTQVQLAHGMQRMMVWASRIESLLATVLDLSPIRHMATLPPINVPPPPSIIIDPTLETTDEEKTPVDHPPAVVTIPRKTPPKGSPTADKGVYGVPKRPKTHG